MMPLGFSGGQSAHMDVPQTSKSPYTAWLRSRWRRLLGLALTIPAALLLATWAFTVFLGGNTHVVIAGQVYRGAQLSPAGLENLVKQHGIRTIINLRGRSEEISWYTQECQVAQRLNLNLEDISFSAYRFPHQIELRELVDVLERAEYPIYLHCRRGADRTGLASAAALLTKTSTTLDDARHHLSIRYGHVALGKPAYLNYFFDVYAAWLRSTGQEHSPERFCHWVRHEYHGGWYTCRFDNFKQEVCRAHEHIPCRVEAHNIGLRAWTMKPVRAAGMHLTWWVRDSKDRTVARGDAGLFEATVPPGDKVELRFAIPPLRAGRYQLLASLEDAKNFYLYQTGSEPLEVEFEVCQ